MMFAVSFRPCSACWASSSQLLLSFPPCFRAFTGYWSVAATEETAMNGVWRKGPGHELFDALMANLGNVPILAEDLGVITDDVVHLRSVTQCLVVGMI